MALIRREQEKLYTDRIGQFVERLGSMVIPESFELDAAYALTAEPVPFAERETLTYRPIRQGDVWGQAWDSAWFVLRGQIPGEWAGKPLAVYLDFNGEAMLYAADGRIIGGLANSSVFMAPAGRPLRALHRIAGTDVGGGKVTYWVEAAANGLFGLNQPADPPRSCPQRHGTYQGKVNHIRLGIYDHAVWLLRIETELLHQLLRSLPQSDTRRVRILHRLSDAVDRFGGDPANAPACRALVKPLLDCPAVASATVATAVGHAHIDTAWLWPVRETVRKTGRTFASQLALLDRYPEYVFGASQAQLYAFAKSHYPELYRQIKQRVAEGRWEVQGAMWVEADCNLIGGEAMVRQILHGKLFFLEEFAVDVRNLWLPDVFGYSAALPQILKRAGIDYFLTQKLSWSQFNNFPFTTFRWRGIDGSEVITHFPPENTYNSLLHAGGLRKAEENFREKGLLDEMMCLFGVGDGGGGPTDDIIERGRLAADLEGLPKVRFGRADAFFERLAPHAAELPVWDGELYLEMHRGTLTTQARTKRGNRKLELALRETEYLCSFLPPDDYPARILDQSWKMLLINQFHDIIPGSSIRLVYEQTEAEHARCLESCARLRDDAAGRLFPGAPDSSVLVNTLNFPVHSVIDLPPGTEQAPTMDGVALPVQREADGRVVAAASLAPQAVASLTFSGGAIPDAATDGDALLLENDLVRYRFAADGCLVEAWDKVAGRPIMGPGDRGNTLSLYEDRPVQYDAWDVDCFYERQLLESARVENVRLLARGPVRQVVEFRLLIGDSRIVQRVSLAAGSCRLDFDTEVEWCERHRMLRTAFTVEVTAGTAAFDIQYGYIHRPTHRNTSWDAAKFEVVAQRYADLSAADYGVALINDCKYGYKVHERTLDLNLLRSPTYPDPDADLGMHRFAYALLPHAGGLCESGVMREAAAFNQPPMLLPGRRAAAVIPPVTVTGEGVGLETLKRAERGPEHIIRIVETMGRRATAAIRPADPAVRLVECDLLERNDLHEFAAGPVRLSLAPFDIRTFRLLDSPPRSD